MLYLFTNTVKLFLLTFSLLILNQVALSEEFIAVGFDSNNRYSWYKIKAPDSITPLGSFGQKGEFIGYGNWLSLSEKNRVRVVRDEVGQFRLRVEGIKEDIQLAVSKGEGDIVLDRDVDSSGGSDVVIILRKKHRLVWRIITDPFLGGRDLRVKRVIYGMSLPRNISFLFKNRGKNDKLALLQRRIDKNGDAKIRNVLYRNVKSLRKRRISIKESDLDFKRPLVIRGNKGRDYFGFYKKDQIILINHRGKKIGQLAINEEELVVIKSGQREKLVSSNLHNILNEKEVRVISQNNISKFKSNEFSPTELPTPTITFTQTAIPTATFTPSLTLTPTSTSNALPTITPLPSPSITPTPQFTPTTTPSNTIAPTLTSTSTPTVTPTFTPTPDTFNLQITVENLNTKLRKPNILGTVNDSTAAIKVTVNGVEYSAINIGNGYWMLPGTLLNADLPDGLYNITAQAFRTSGISATDSSINELKVDNLAPQILTTTFPNGGIKDNGQSLNIAVGLNEDVIVSGSPRLSLTLDYSTSSTNPVKYATYQPQLSSADTLVFSYTVSSGDVDINGVTFGASIDQTTGLIKDVLGNNTINYSFTPPTANSNSILVDSLGTSYNNGDYLLDQFPNLNGVAYSLRRLDKDYVGSAIRVRRLSDNQQQDIGFSPHGYLNTSQLSSFVSSQNIWTTNDFRITRWYDQSGNNNFLENTAESEQPKISNSVQSGSSSRIGLLFDGSNDYLISQQGFSFLNQNDFAIEVVTARLSATNTSYIIGQDAPNGAFTSLHVGYRWDTSITSDVFGYGVDGTVQAYTTPTVNLISSYLEQSTGKRIFYNGDFLNLTSNFTPLINSTGGYIGRIFFGGTPYYGIVYEVIIYPNNQLNQRVNIENNIMSFYEIFNFILN
jgi:Alpha-L-arabinofuranosidase B, catalytic